MERPRGMFSARKEIRSIILPEGRGALPGGGVVCGRPPPSLREHNHIRREWMKHSENKEMKPVFFGEAGIHPLNNKSASSRDAVSAKSTPRDGGNGGGAVR